MLHRLVIAVLAAALVSLALVAGASAARPVFGIVPQDGALPTSGDLDLMPGAGIESMRTMLHWPSIEKTPGEYDWTEADAVIRETTNRGIQPLVFLYGLPEWAAKRDNYPCGGPQCTVYAPKSPETRAAFGAFAAAAAARYGPGGSFWEAPANAAPAANGGTDPVVCEITPELCPPPPPTDPPPPPPTEPPPPGEPPCGCTTPSPIRVWQIWNEQNSSKYFAPKVNVRRYAAMLRSAAAGIRATDPGAEVMLGGMWGPYSARQVVMPTNDYLQDLYDLGAEKSFDSIAIHPYGNNAGASIAQLRSARRVLVDNRDPGAKMWVTEVGWAGRGPSDNPYVKGLAGQARILTRALTAFMSERRDFKLQGVFWYSWRDIKGGETTCDWCGHAGLRAKDGSEKPAWRAFVRLARR